MAPAELILKEKTNIALALKAIAEGYPVTGQDDRYIVVQNPDYAEGGRGDPCLVIDTYPIFDLLRCMGVSI